jgi:hypothetical protein
MDDLDLIFTGFDASRGFSGHAPAAFGEMTTYGGQVNSGRQTLSALATPTAPTVTPVGGSGTSYSYALVCHDFNTVNPGVTLPSSFTTASGGANLGGVSSATIYTGGGGTGYAVNDTLRPSPNSPLTGNNDAVFTVASISGGGGTGPIATLSVTTPGTLYRSSPTYYGAATTTLTGSGHGATVNWIAEGNLIAPVNEDGCFNWDILKTNTSTSLATAQLISATVPYLDYGQSTSAYSEPSRNSTGDQSVAGQITEGGNAVPITVAHGSSALDTNSINSAACDTTTVSASGVVSTDVVEASFNGDPTGVTGYVPATTGMLTIIPYPGSGSVNFEVCNNSGSAIKPGAITLNWRVTR